MEKLELRRADNLTTAELTKVMSENYETYNIILEEIIERNIEYAIEYLENLKGVKFYGYTFGSVYNNDYEAEFKNIDEFLTNHFNSGNDTFYELLDELEKDKDNVKLQNELLNMLFSDVDSYAMYDDYGIDEVVDSDSDVFDNWLNYYEMAVDMNSYKLYSSYELEELDLDIDYQDL